MIWPDKTNSLCARMCRGFNGQDANGLLLVHSRCKRSANTNRGGALSNLQSRDYKYATDLVVDKQNRRYIARRLTPLECCRLQGFPDYWTEGVPGSDSAKYKMWGNGMALPCLLYVLEGLEEEPR